MLKSKIAGMFLLLYKNIVLILLVATVCVVLSVGYTTFNQKAAYVAEAEIVVHNGDLGNTALGSGENALSFIPTVERIFNSRSVFEHFKLRFMADSSYTTEEFSDMIKVKAEGKNSLFMTVTVTADTADEALKLANAFCSCLDDFIHSVAHSISLTVISAPAEAELLRANIPTLAVSGFLSGAVITSLLVLLFGGRRRSIHNAADYKSKYSLPLIGSVPDFETKGGK